MPPFERHIFICGNQRPADHPRGSCNPKGNDELQKAFKQKLADHQIPSTTVRANKSGCLEQCEHGPTVVVYPDAVWYGRVTREDVDKIIDSHIMGGKPVAELALPDTCINAARCAHKPRNVTSAKGEPG
jgi:(2Fe-2S) ferredoxin